ncbi:MAG: hypothetical protein ACTS4X_01750 [Candidatus Hodgkinia cicadicola]
MTGELSLISLSSDLTNPPIVNLPSGRLISEVHFRRPSAWGFT